MKKYWKNFYQHHHTLRASPFAKFVKKFFKGIKTTKTMIDVGCGNGRDSYYFARKGWNVFGIDFACRPIGGENLTFIEDDICNYIKRVHCSFELIYARFFFHSVDGKTLDDLLFWGSGWIAIEARSDEELTYHNHDRFIRNSDILLKKLLKYGYKIVYFEEAKNLAKYKSENPWIIRIIAKK